MIFGQILGDKFGLFSHKFYIFKARNPKLNVRSTNKTVIRI